MVWQKLGTVDSDDTPIMELTGLAEKKFLVGLIHQTGFASADSVELQEGLISYQTTGYARRVSTNGAVDTTSINQPSHFLGINNETDSAFIMYYFCQFNGEEHLLIEFGVEEVAAGAGTPPDRKEMVSKQILGTQSDQFKAFSAQNFTSDSNFSILGTD